MSRIQGGTLVCDTTGSSSSMMNLHNQNSPPPKKYPTKGAVLLFKLLRPPLLTRNPKRPASWEHPFSIALEEVSTNPSIALSLV